jgi:uncharacterized protein (TIGR00106 family)
MLAEFSIIPIGVGESVSQYVADCLRIVDDSGIDYRLNPMGTVLEGDYDKVMAVIAECHKSVASSCARVVTTIRIDDRRGRTDALRSKMESVEEKIEKRLRK